MSYLRWIEAVFDENKGLFDENKGHWEFWTGLALYVLLWLVYFVVVPMG